MSFTKTVKMCFMIDLQMKILTEKAITISEGEIVNRFAEPKQIY